MNFATISSRTRKATSTHAARTHAAHHLLHLHHLSHRAGVEHLAHELRVAHHLQVDATTCCYTCSRPSRRHRASSTSKSCGSHTCRSPGLASTAARSCGLAWTMESCNMQSASGCHVDLTMGGQLRGVSFVKLHTTASIDEQLAMKPGMASICAICSCICGFSSICSMPCWPPASAAPAPAPPSPPAPPMPPIICEKSGMPPEHSTM